jgi:tetratricopeptide (TPR) repeat protein
MLTLQPDDRDTMAILEVVRYYKTKDPAGIRSLIARLSPADLANPSTLLTAMNLEITLGDTDEVLRLDTAHPDAAALGVHLWDRSLFAATILFARGDLAGAARRIGDYPAAVRKLLEAQPNNVSLWSELSAMEAVLGHKEASLAAIERALAILPTSKDALTGPGLEVQRVTWEAWFGNKDKAIEEIKRLLRLPGGIDPNDVKISPQWQPLRGMPRFEALISDPTYQTPIL